MSDWRSDVCSSDLRDVPPAAQVGACAATRDRLIRICAAADLRISGSSLPNATLSRRCPAPGDAPWPDSRVRPRDPSRTRSEEHTSELQSLMRISYAVFCLKKKKKSHR